MTLFTRYLCAIIGLFLVLPQPAWADVEISFGHEVVDFINSPISLETERLTKTELQDAVVDLVEEMSESVFASDPDRLSKALNEARLISEIDDESWDQAVSLAESVLKLMQTEAPETLKPSLAKLFDEYEAEENWYLKSVANSIAAYLYMSQNQLLVGTERTDKALDIIPSELSAKVTAARIMASEAAMLLHGLQGNAEFMLDAARLQRNAKAMIGEDLNRYELLTNFVYAFNRSRDYKSAAIVASALIDEPMPENAVPGVSEAYMAATFNETGDYATAEGLAKSALVDVQHPVVDQRGNLELLVAYAGQGKTRLAEALMREREWKHSAGDLLNTVDNQSILHAEALLAMHREETAFSLALMKRRADLLIKQVQSANSADISGMLSNLENTRERQMEREGALQREAELKAVQLEQKTNLNRLLWVLIAGLTIAFNLLLAFLRYRERTNAKVQDLQEDALSAEKMKTEFLGVINHELRTPLNGIIGISDAMIHHADDPVMREQAQTVQESGQLLFDLLDSLITMSTIEGNRLSLDSVESELAEDISREVEDWREKAETKGLTYTHFIGSELDEVLMSDPKRIRQSLRFLISNAIRFTHKGRVHIHATGRETGTGHMELTLIVADTGQGINKDVQSRLFKPFLQADATMTRKYGGAGLSLAIARKLARMMGGDLTVNSREGRGSEFIFTSRLPIASANQSETIPTLETTKASKVVPALNLDRIDDPETIIDAMLDKQLFTDAFSNPPAGEGSAQPLLQEPYKTAS